MIKKSLSKLSFDKNNRIVVCNYKNEFIDLDETKGVLKKSHSPNSPDMVYIDEKRREIWFIEFKSSSKENLSTLKEKVKLKKKIFAGLFLIYEIFCEKSCKYKDYNKFYFVVFKEEIKNYEDRLLNLSNRENDRKIEFALEDLKPQFLTDIFTENCDRLKKLFEKRFNINFIKEKNE